MAKQTATIVGGGLAGALMAVYLGRRGYQVHVVERRPDIRKATISAGRSINLAISTRGFTALAGVELEGKVREMCVPMRGRALHSTSGEVAFQPYGTEEGQAINSVSRGGLNQLLLEEAEKLDNVTLEFELRCVDFDFDEASATFENSEGEQKTIRSDFLIGADGAFSAIRGRLARSERFDYSQSYLDCGYKELEIPPAEGGGFRIEENALHIWPRNRAMMIALPNVDGSFTCTLFWPFEGNHSFAELDTPEKVRSFFEKEYPDAISHMPTFVEDYLANPTSSLVTVRCYPWSFGEKGTLIGDAAHAIVPFYGQGMNAAFEDCRILDECLANHSDNLERAFDAFQKMRKPNVDALADLAIENFREMRDYVTSPWFLFKKKLGKFMHKVAPKFFVPLYTMVTFSNTPYAEARERSAKQVRTLQIAGISIVALGALITMRWIWN